MHGSVKVHLHLYDQWDKSHSLPPCYCALRAHDPGHLQVGYWSRMRHQYPTWRCARHRQCTHNNMVGSWANMHWSDMCRSALKVTLLCREFLNEWEESSARHRLTVKLTLLNIQCINYLSTQILLLISALIHHGINLIIIYTHVTPSWDIQTQKLGFFSFCTFNNLLLKLVLSIVFKKWLNWQEHFSLFQIHCCYS